MIARTEIASLRADNARLQRIIDKGARHWIALQVNNPIKWEGDLGEAMGAACAEIARLQRELEEAADASGEWWAGRAVCLQRETLKLREQVEALRRKKDEAISQRPSVVTMQALQDRIARAEEALRDLECERATSSCLEEGLEWPCAACRIAAAIEELSK